MTPVPRNLDYFRLGCAAGNYMNIFTSKPVREQMLDCLRRLRLMFEREIGPMYLMLRTLPGDLPAEDTSPYHERFPEYCSRVLDLKDLVRSQYAPRHFYWFMLGEALYHLAIAASRRGRHSLDGPVIALRTGLIATKPPKSVLSMCDGFIRLAKQRKGNDKAIFRLAGKIETVVTAHLDMSVE